MKRDQRYATTFREGRGRVFAYRYGDEVHPAISIRKSTLRNRGSHKHESNLYIYIYTYVYIYIYTYVLQRETNSKTFKKSGVWPKTISVLIECAGCNAFPVLPNLLAMLRGARQSQDLLPDGSQNKKTFCDLQTCDSQMTRNRDGQAVYPNE